MLIKNLKIYSTLSLYLYSLLFFIQDDIYYTNIKLPNISYFLILPIGIYLLTLFKEKTIPKSEMIFIIALVISLVSVLITGDTEFFYPIVVLILSIRLRVSSSQFRSFITLYLILNFGYLILNYGYASGMINYYIFEPHAFTYYSSGNDWRLKSSTLFYNSNGAGAAHSIIYLFILLYSNHRRKKLLLKCLVLFFVIISGSMSSLGFIMAIEMAAYYKKTKYKVLALTVASIVLIPLIVYFYQTNYIGFIVRIERIWSFLYYIISNPLTFIVPSYILIGSFYTESTFLDLFLNFGAFAILIYMIILKSRAKSYLFYLLLTSSSLTVFPAFLLGQIISENEKIPN